MSVLILFLPVAFTGWWIAERFSAAVDVAVAQAAFPVVHSVDNVAMFAFVKSFEEPADIFVVFTLCVGGKYGVCADEKICIFRCRCRREIAEPWH